MVFYGLASTKDFKLSVEVEIFKGEISRTKFLVPPLHSPFTNTVGPLHVVDLPVSFGQVQFKIEMKHRSDLRVSFGKLQ